MLMPIMLHGDGGQSHEPPASPPQPGAELELLERVEIPVGEIADGLDGAAAIKTALVEPIDLAWLAVGLLSHGRGPDLELVGLQVALLDDPADACAVGVVLQEADGLGEEARLEHHVALHEIEELAPAVLEGQLCSCSAAPLLHVAKLDDLDRIASRNVQRRIGRPAVRDHDLPLPWLHGCERAFDGGRDLPFFIEGFDPNAHRHGTRISTRLRRPGPARSGRPVPPGPDLTAAASHT